MQLCSSDLTDCLQEVFFRTQELLLGHLGDY